MLAGGKERGEKEESDAAVGGEEAGVWRGVAGAKAQLSEPRESSRHEPIHHCRTQQPWQGRLLAKHQAEGRCRAGIAAVRGHWRGIVAERVALLPPESLGRDSRQ